MIDFKSYVDNCFAPLDIVGTTSFGAASKAIWRYTWAKMLPFPWSTPYRRRAHQSTHVAVTCVGLDGKKWLMEMDNTVCQKRYASKEMRQIILPEEYDTVKHSLSHEFQEINVFSGIKLTDPETYFAKSERAPHVCWIGRSKRIHRELLSRGNEWLFKKRREGVQYDYLDIIGLLAMAKKWRGVMGNSDVYVCSEFPQKCFEYIGVICQSPIPMTPQDWQQSTFMEEVKV